MAFLSDLEGFIGLQCAEHDIDVTIGKRIANLVRQMLEAQYSQQMVYIPKHRQKQLINQKHSEIIADFKTGMKVKEIAKKYGYSRVWIAKILDKHEVLK